MEIESTTIGAKHPFKLEFFAYETMGAACYNEWGMSMPPAGMKREHDWRPLGFLFRPLKWLGVLRPKEEPGVFYYSPMWLADLTHWRPLSGHAYRRWARAGKPGYLEKLKFDI